MGTCKRVRYQNCTAGWIDNWSWSNLNSSQHNTNQMGATSQDMYRLQGPVPGQNLVTNRTEILECLKTYLATVVNLRGRKWEVLQTDTDRVTLTNTHKTAK